MLLNKKFLLDLDNQQNTEVYARVTLLNNKELPIESIEGRITSSGAVNIDGNSAIRRSCSLTMVSNSVNYHEHYWTLKNKFKLEIGIRNDINPAYPEIIWFPQGIYVFTSFSTNHSTNNFTISLQGKDKGCLINGELGGIFNTSVDLGTIETIEKDEETQEEVSIITKLEIKDILINMMHQYAGEPFKNIIINDLSEEGLELLEYRGKERLFLYRAKDSATYDNAFLEKSAPDFYDGTTKVDFTAEHIEGLETLVETLEDTPTPKLFTTGGKEYYIACVSYGQTGGYRKTNLVYPGDLIIKAGETVVSVLDKIKQILGQYEYFYDVEGRFVFQKKRYFVNSPIDINTNTDEEMLPKQDEIAYTFNNLKLFQSFNNNPNLSQLRNDFSIWGERKGISGTPIPVLLRYALDEKPAQYTSIKVEPADLVSYNAKYNLNLQPQDSITYIAADSWSKAGNVIYCDWRELIYQMASDNFKYGHLDNFELLVAKSNSKFYPEGITGYEQYYLDILGNWRKLYVQPNADEIDDQIKSKNDDIKTKEDEKNGYKNYNAEIIQAKVTRDICWAALQTARGAEWAAKQAYDALVRQGRPSFWLLQGAYDVARGLAEAAYKGAKDLADIAQDAYDDAVKAVQTAEKDNASKYEALVAQRNEEIQKLQEEIQKLLKERIDHPWNKSINSSPETLNFWFDFLDSEGQVEQYSVRKIGSRAKVINDSSIKAIYFRKTPEVIFTDSDSAESQEYLGYRTIQVSDIDTMFSISSQGKSAKEELDSLLQAHLFTVDSISLQVKPIYYLEPNSKIRIEDKDTGTFGDYIISRLTLPLTYNGMMSITASKAVKNIF